MSAFKFPSQPVENGTVVTNPKTGVIYCYDSTNDVWKIIGNSNSNSINLNSSNNNNNNNNNTAELDSQIAALTEEIQRLDQELAQGLDEREELVSTAQVNDSAQNARLDVLEEHTETDHLDTTNYWNKTEADQRFITQSNLEAYLSANYLSIDHEVNHPEQEHPGHGKPNMSYSDYPPTGATSANGDLWFDAMNLRLNVFSQGVWINPDRNDGQTLEDRIATLEARLAQLEGN